MGTQKIYFILKGYNSVKTKRSKTVFSGTDKEVFGDN